MGTDTRITAASLSRFHVFVHSASEAVFGARRNRETMADPPRRRRRKTTRARSLPLIPILLGVIVLGLAFGAGLSVLTQLESNAPIAVVTAAPTPSIVPLLRSTPSPVPRTRVAKIVASPAAWPSATAQRVALATPAPNAEPSVAATAKATAPRALVTAAPHALEVITPVPTIPPYAVVATEQPRAAPSDEADSDFARVSAAVVRAYFASLVRGDDASARAVLTPSQRGNLGEKGFVDSSFHITSLDAHGTGDSATVNVDLATSRGEYFEQFYLRRSPTGAAMIVEHTYIRP